MFQKIKFIIGFSMCVLPIIIIIVYAYKEFPIALWFFGSILGVVVYCGIAKKLMGL